jgi:polyhydroxyalkanoate synthesis regulator phasin
MNSDNLTQLLQKGFRVTLGATATLVESIQDPQLREENLSQLQGGDFVRLTESWEAKGTSTEVEARNFVTNLWQQQMATPSPSAGDTTSPSPTTTAPTEVQQDLQELTAQIAAMRAEVEKLRQNNS